MKRLLPDLAALLLLIALAPLWLGLAYRGHRVAALDVAALPVMLPTVGLHELEPLGHRPGSFRWTTGEATLEPPNPGGPLYLRLTMASGLDSATPTTLSVGGTRHELTVLPGLHTYSLALPAQPGERVAIELSSPTTAIDGRALGVMVQRLLVAGDDQAPPGLVGAMILATLGAYPLLRRAGMPTAGAAATALGLQLLAAAWQWAGAWRYGLLGPLLTLGGLGALAGLAAERIWPPAAAASAPWPALGRRDSLAVLGLMGLALLLCLPWLGAPDPVGDLELSARRMGFMVERGGISQAFTFGGDYMPFRLYILRALALLVPPLGGEFYDPIPAVTRAIIKLPSLIALLLTVALIYRWARRYRGVGGAALIAGLYAVAPPVWMNVAWWGQVDVLLTLPMVAALALIDRAGGRWSWLCWAAALLIKPQAIVLAPLLFAITARRHGPRGLAVGGGLAALLIGLASAPFVLAGQGQGLYQAAVGSVGRFPQVTNRAYNLWWLVVHDRAVSDLTTFGPLSYRAIGMALVLLVAALVMLLALRRPDPPAWALGAAVIALAFFALPTQIHERYSFFALPFLLLAAAADRRLLLPFGLLTATATLNIIGAIGGFAPALHLAIKGSPLTTALAWAHLIILAGLLAALCWPRGRGGPSPERAAARGPGDAGASASI